MICEWGSVMHTKGNGYGRPALYFRQQAENHSEDSQCLGQNVTLNFLNTKETIFWIQNDHSNTHLVSSIHPSTCAKQYLLWNTCYLWECCGIQTAYNTGNYLYIKCRISMLSTPCNEIHLNSQSHYLHNTVCITQRCSIYSDMFQRSHAIIRKCTPICLKPNGYYTTTLQKHSLL
jgi:hypothetical protein